MATVRGGTVRSHVQAFADACAGATGASSFGTYPGHSPTLDRALDIFVPTTSRTVGDAICDFAQRHQKRYGVDYVIYRQRIWNPDISSAWRAMADRGDLTQNHFDHVHISFEAEGADEPQPEPTPEPEDNDMAPCIIKTEIDGGTFTYLDSAGGISEISGEGAANFVAAGAKEVWVTAVDFQRMVERTHRQDQIVERLDAILARLPPK